MTSMSIRRAFAAWNSTLDKTEGRKMRLRYVWRVLFGSTGFGVVVLAWVWLVSMAVPALAEEDVEERYVLVMSRNDGLCGHMLDRFNADLRKYGWNGDAHQESLPEFTAVPWGAVRVADAHGHVDEVLYASTRGAVFDIDNDGVDEFVVRFIGSLSGLRADSVSVFDNEIAAPADSLRADMLWNSPNRISLAGSSYKLAGRKEKLIDPRVISPFLYDGVSYILMRGLFEADRTWAGYAVIAKYGGGALLKRKRTGDMEDICYYRRVGPARMSD